MGVSTKRRPGPGGADGLVNQLVPSRRDAKAMPRPIANTLGKMFKMTSQTAGFNLPSRVSLLSGSGK